MAKKRNRLFEIRSILGLTQADFGQRLGVTKTYIYLIESGRKPLSDNILNLAELLLAQYDPQKPSDIPQDSLVQIRAELAHLRTELAVCKAQLKEAHATIALQARTIASLHAASTPKN
ncbi:MAG: helix-turn-helix transcriptional regulator [Lentisphaerae bacterium]|nr:helix-turn-helix transcriptional regulator [Lentisphaerota bacterium]